MIGERLSARFSQWLLKLMWETPAQDDAEKAQKALDEDCYLTFTSDPGKRVLQYLVTEHYHAISFAVTESRLTDFNEGKRALVQEILARMDRVRFPLRYEMKVETHEKKE